MKGNIHKQINMLTLTILLIAAVTMVIAAADGASPGSQADPIVTQSYVEQKSEQIKYYIDSLIAKSNESITKTNDAITKINTTEAQQNTEILKQSGEIAKLKTDLEAKSQEIVKLKEQVDKLSQSTDTTPASSGKFEVVPLKKDKIILSGEGAEIILRSGKATGVTGTYGALCDVTAGRDLKSGESIGTNHMLISSRGDGRGVKALADCYFIIKGSYTLK